MAATTSSVVGLATSSLPSLNSKQITLNSAFLRSATTARNPLRVSQASGGKYTCSFQRDWLRRDLNVIGFGLIGWLAPSSIPIINVNIPYLNQLLALSVPRDI
nr:photosystem I subunit O [Tanacetum cinerariifolium]